MKNIYLFVIYLVASLVSFGNTDYIEFIPGSPKIDFYKNPPLKKNLSGYLYLSKQEIFHNIELILSKKPNQSNLRIFCDPQIWVGIDIHKEDLETIKRISQRIYPITNKFLGITSLVIKKNIHMNHFKIIENYLPNLEEINIIHTTINYKQMKFLTQLFNNVRKIEINQCSISDSNSWHIFFKQIPMRLESLSLISCNVITHDLGRLPSILSLKEINLSNTKLKDPEHWIHFINNLPTSLESINLSKTNYNGSRIDFLCSLNDLKYLDLSNNYWDVNEYWQELSNNIPLNIKRINTDNSNCPLKIKSEIQNIITVNDNFSL